MEKKSHKYIKIGDNRDKEVRIKKIKLDIDIVVMILASAIFMQTRREKSYNL